MVFIHVYHSEAWLVDDYRDPALETNITTTVTGAATWDPLLEPAKNRASPAKNTFNFSHSTSQISVNHSKNLQNGSMYSICFTEIGAYKYSTSLPVPIS